MPAAVVAGEGVDLVDDDGLQAVEQHCGADALGYQHRLQGFGCGEQDVGAFTLDAAAGGRAHVPMPGGGLPAQPLRVAGDPWLQVVQEGLERADVEHGDPGPALRFHPAQQREHRCLGLAASRRGQQDRVRARGDRCHRLVLERSKTLPAERVDDVVLDDRTEQIEPAAGFRRCHSSTSSAVTA